MTGKLNVAKNCMCAKCKIVKLNGGLGNQMFQYAFALALAEKFGTKMLFDFSYFEDVKSHENVTTRFFELGVFNLECTEAEEKDLTEVKNADFGAKWKNTLAKRYPHYFGVNYAREKNNTCFDKKLITYPDYAYYEGYFQNENYFKHLREQLFRDFSLKMPFSELNEQNQSTLEKIISTNSVSIHIRRGDYVTLDYVNKLQGICPLKYYQKAIKRIAKKVENPHFFIFSDDIDWVRENLKIDYPYTVIDFNQNSGYLDLELMKNCKHNIIANSSFSWWGAWLNENPDKIVIAPKKWNKMRSKKCDIVPKSWVKL